MRFMILSAALLLPACLPTPADSFIDELSALCGQSFAGEIVSTDAVDDDWRREDITVYFAECSNQEVRMPLAVGADTSRTWIVRRSADGGYELRHQHLHEDGTPDALSNYGGYSDPANQGSRRQEFPASEDTKSLFDAEGIPVSKDNVWAIELREDVLAYELRRPERFFRIEFDPRDPLED